MVRIRTGSKISVGGVQMKNEAGGLGGFVGLVES